MTAAIRLDSETVERLRAALTPDPVQWRYLLRGNEPRADGCHELGESEFLALASFAELDPDSILAGRIDFKALARHRAGDLGHIPEEYQAAARSRVRTSAHLLDHVEVHRGWRLRLRLLRRLQVTEAAVADLDRTISVRFITHLCDALVKTGLTYEELYRMGQYSVLTNLGTPIGEALMKLQGPRELFEKIFTDLIGKYWDRNFDYRLMSLASDHCIVEAVPSSEVTALLSQRMLGNAATCAARAGTFSSLTGYLSLPSARVTETRCIHRGDPRCRYHIDFSASNH